MVNCGNIFFQLGTDPWMSEFKLWKDSLVAFFCVSIPSPIPATSFVKIPESRPLNLTSREYERSATIFVFKVGTRNLSNVKLEKLLEYKIPIQY